MVFRATGWMMVGAALVVAGCGARSLDPGMDSMNPDPSSMGGTGGSSMTKPSPPPPPMPESELVATLRANNGPDMLLVLGNNGGAMTSATKNDGLGLMLPQDPEAMDEAAAVAGVRTCSVEPQGLTLFPKDVNATTMIVTDAVTSCLNEDLTDMRGRLASLKTPSTVVVIAANTAITVHSTNNGINFFYDADILKLLHVARELYVPACVVTPDALALPSPEGQTPGLSIEDALARCGRM